MTDADALSVRGADLGGIFRSPHRPEHIPRGDPSVAATAARRSNSATDSDSDSTTVRVMPSATRDLRCGGRLRPDLASM